MRKSAEKSEIRGLRAAARRVAAWRSVRRIGAPMPEALWREAVELAQTHGVGPTAKGLGLDHGKLRKLAGERAGQKSRSGRGSVPSFVDVGLAGELTAVSGPFALAATEIEIELTTGDRLTIRTPAGHPLDIAQLVHELRGRR